VNDTDAGHPWLRINREILPSSQTPQIVPELCRNSGSWAGNRWRFSKRALARYMNEKEDAA